LSQHLEAFQVVGDRLDEKVQILAKISYYTSRFLLFVCNFWVF
jgi:hypothetical protein